MAAWGFHFWGVGVGWRNNNLPGIEFRQAQTAISAYFIKQEGSFSLAYPTPVLGKPWSVPMEFPLYQWAAVVTDKATGWGLTESGRAVSIACFYLTLPGLFLLLAWWQIAPARRFLVLAVVVSCPFYIFYGRSFLMETMALMFSIWFCVAFSRAVAQRSAGWLLVAALAGSGGGLVKVTTFMLYLLPAAGWATRRLWQGRRDRRWKFDLVWMAAAVSVPFGATAWWIGFADATKALNPLAGFLTSENLKGFNLGTNATRLSPELWAMKWRIVREELTWLPLVGGAVFWLTLSGRHRWREVVICVAIFAAAPGIFPELYAYHDYYYAANLLWLLVAVGVVLVALAESRLRSWIVGAAALSVVGAQAHFYLTHYFPLQRSPGDNGGGVSHVLRLVTEPGEIVVIAGQDWNSMIPYYAQRRALMLREDVARDSAQSGKALAGLAGEKIGALVITGHVDQHQGLFEQMILNGMSPTLVFSSRDTSIFLSADRVRDALQAFGREPAHGVRLAPGHELPPAKVAPQVDFKGQWHDVAMLPPTYQAMFDGMQPKPVRFFCSFGLSVERSNGVMDFGAHPVTRLVFSLSPGQHTLRTKLVFSPDSYREDLAEADKTDGVQFRISLLGEKDVIVFDQWLNPVRRVSDRGRLVLAVPFSLAEAGEVELFIGPGPGGRDARDWVALDRLVIQ